MRFLFLDDSAVARALTGKLLRARGLDVVICSTNAEATAHDPATLKAALLDLEVGDEYGTEVAVAFRSRSPEFPVAFLTATTDEALLERARALGPVFNKTSDLERAVAWVASHRP